MLFGERLQALRKAKGYTLRELASMVGVGFTYLSKAENGKLAFADVPGEALILKLAKALDAGADELLILAKKIPPVIKKRVLERPNEFLQIAKMDDESFERLVAGIKTR
jgi:transcriptional regulator with XRE-family HTH domain